MHGERRRAVDLRHPHAGRRGGSNSAASAPPPWPSAMPASGSARTPPGVAAARVRGAARSESPQPARTRTPMAAARVACQPKDDGSQRRRHRRRSGGIRHPERRVLTQDLPHRRADGGDQFPPAARGLGAQAHRRRRDRRDDPRPDPRHPVHRLRPDRADIRARAGLDARRPRCSSCSAPWCPSAAMSSTAGWRAGSLRRWYKPLRRRYVSSACAHGMAYLVPPWALGHRRGRNPGVARAAGRRPADRRRPRRVRDDAARVAAASALRAQFDALEGQVRDIAGLFEASRRRRAATSTGRSPRRCCRARTPTRSSSCAIVRRRERAAFERDAGVRRSASSAPDGSLRLAGRRDRYLVVTCVVARRRAGATSTASTCWRCPGGGTRSTGPGATGEVAATALGRAELQRRARAARLRPRVTAGGGSRGFVAGAFSDSVLFDAVRHALRRDVGLRVTNGGAVVGAQGTCRGTPSAHACRLRRPGVRRVGRAAPERGLRFGPLGVRPRRCC